jgi:hypothetical protein
MLGSHLTRTRIGLVLAVIAGAVLGAVFGQPGSGRAASTAVPKNTKAPGISGTAIVGSTLVATRGTWSGSPTSFHFAWSRCDATGAACLAIGGATAKIYTVTAADVGHTLRVTVTAKNASGSASATSAATALVPTNGCPSTTGTVPVAALVPPERLQIANASVAPSLTRSTNTIRIRVVIQACGTRPVQGATVYATAIPYNQFSAVQGTTGADGSVTLTEGRRSGFPASPHQRLLAVFVRASKPGDPALGGVSSRRVVAFPFAHH